MARTGLPERMALKPALADAAIAALVILVLTLPIVGFQTVGTGGILAIHYHFGMVAGLAGVGFAGRLAGNLWFRKAGDARSAKSGRLSPLLARHSATLGYAGLAAAVAMPFLANSYYIDLGTTVLIYVMLGWGLNIVVGLAGLLDLGYVAFYAVGAYTVGLLATNFGWGFWACLPLSGLFAACFGIMLGFPVLRLRGDYLAIVTLGFGEIIRVVLLNWAIVTNGPNGIGGIPRPSFFGLPFTGSAPEGSTSFADFFGLDYDPTQRLIFLYFVILGLALLTNLFTLRMRRLPVGRAWEALREDEIACRAIGINATNIKLSAFSIGAMFGGLAGAFFATRQGFISPESFNFTESATILAIVVLGGLGSQLGVVLAAMVLVMLPELARGLADYRMLLFGAAMVLIMVVRPRGLLAHRHPSILLHGKVPR
ncbi:MAG: branched-chain amino acid transport system permease protein [Aliidongia sp.]|jgi:branched-chain amino acid transport system permease protein|nr:branched-chain amino acid transport system permease protein [Aliidongia sp.]